MGRTQSDHATTGMNRITFALATSTNPPHFYAPNERSAYESIPLAARTRKDNTNVPTNICAVDLDRRLPKKVKPTREATSVNAAT